MAPVAFALVIMINGWVQGAPASRGNMVSHIPGFTTEAKCEVAGESIQKASMNPKIVKTACIEIMVSESTAGSEAAGYSMAVLINGWEDGLASGARGNAFDHISGFADKKKCQTAADKIRALSANPDITKTLCVEF